MVAATNSLAAPMLRPPRLELSEIPLHITHRCVNRAAIFPIGTNRTMKSVSTAFLLAFLLTSVSSAKERPVPMPLSEHLPVELVADPDTLSVSVPVRGQAPGILAGLVQAAIEAKEDSNAAARVEGI